MKKTFTFLFGIFCMLSVANAQDITVFDFDGVTPTFTGSDPVVTIANPTTDGINASVNIGQLTHIGQYNDANTTVDIDPRVYTSIEMMVYSPYSTTGKVTIACFDASGNQLDWYESSAIATAGVWSKVTRNISFTKKIASVKVGFNRNDAPSATANDNIVYYDNLVFKKSPNPFITLYYENFNTSWVTTGYGNDPWSGSPSTVAINTTINPTANSIWFGGIDLQTTGGANMHLDQWWGDYGHYLNLGSTDADVIIPNINVAGFDNLKLSFDISNNQWSTPMLPIVNVKVGTGDWVSVVTSLSGNWWGMANQIDLLKNADGTPISNVSTISIKLSPSLDGSLFYDNVKILGEVHSITTSLSGASKDVFSIYPNPATNYILTKNAQKVTILDLNGRLVKEAFNAEKVDVSSLAKGAYIVKAQIGNDIKIGKLIKE